MRKSNNDHFQNCPAVRLFLPLIMIIMAGLVAAIIFTIIDNPPASADTEPAHSQKISEESSENTSEITDASSRISVTIGSWANDAYYSEVSFIIFGLEQEEIDAVEMFKKMKAVFKDDPDFRIGLSAGSFEVYDGALILSMNLHLNPAISPGRLFYDKVVQFEFEDIGTMESIVIKGSWSCEITMAGSETTLKYDTNITLDDLGYELKSIEISPLSVYAEFSNHSGGQACPAVEAIILTDNTKIGATGDRMFLDKFQRNSMTTGSYKQIVFTDQIKAVVFSQKYSDPAQPNGLSYRHAEVYIADIIGSQPAQ